VLAVAKMVFSVVAYGVEVMLVAPENGSLVGAGGAAKSRLNVSVPPPPPLASVTIK